MDYLQYWKELIFWKVWQVKVLNLIINGLPSISKSTVSLPFFTNEVLNLIINGLPSIFRLLKWVWNWVRVLNLIINGLPSILKTLNEKALFDLNYSFKPYYKWITFNIK